MTEAPRPRNIRDIAHLYLSRSVNPAETSVLNIFVAASTKNSLPGFHVANIAAALATRLATVRVFELSGHLPNVAFYFARRPREYLVGFGEAIGEFSPGLNSISIAFDPIRLMSEHDRQDQTRVNVIHLPSADDAVARRDLMNRLEGRLAGDHWGLCIAAGHAPPPRSLGADLGVRMLFTVSVDGEPTSAAPKGPGDLGQIVGWDGAVSDRLPAVVRNPRSRLSRQYLAVVESLLGRIHSMRKRFEPSRAGARVEPAR